MGTIILILLLLLFIFDPLSVVVSLGVAIIASIILGIISSKKIDAETAERSRWRRVEEKKAAEEKLQKIIGQLIETYGPLSNTIRLEKWGEIPDIKKCLLVFEESELLYLDGAVILFKDIISYNIIDDYIVKQGASSASTNTITIGAKKEGVIGHKYFLSITVGSLEPSLIRVYLGESTKKAKEVNAILADIVASKEA